MKMEPIESSETSANNTQTLGTYPKESKLQKPGSLKCVWLNINIPTETPKFTDVSKRHVNKNLHSIQCHNICTLLYHLWMLFILVGVWN
jgi:hypothetical protein